MNERVSDDSCESSFKFLVRNGCIKGRKIKGLDDCGIGQISMQMSYALYWRFFVHLAYSKEPVKRHT